MEVADEYNLCFPHLMNASCKKIARPFVVTVLVYTVLYIISLVTTALNLLIIVSISHYKQLHTPTNFLILSLAVSDFFVGLLMFVLLLSIDGCWFLGDTLCIIYQLVSLLVTGASIGTIVLISIERFIAIYQPLHYHTRVTERRVQFCICLSWFCAGFYNMLVLKDSIEDITNVSTCHGECRGFINYFAGVVDIFITFFIPVSAISVLYTKVFLVVLTQARAMRSQITAGKTQRIAIHIKSELKAARTLGIIIVMFVLCLCPYYIVTIGQDAFLSAAFAAILYVSYFNSFLNPLIYTVAYPWFRKCLKNIFTLRILQPGSSRAHILSEDL